MAQNARKTFSVRGFAPDAAGGAYSAPPDTVAGGEGDWLPHSNYPLLSALWISLLLSPTPKLCPHLIQAGDAPLNLISATTETCVFLYVGWHLQFLGSTPER